MKFNKGLNTDVNSISQPEGTWRDAKNMLFSRQYDALSNEDGFNELYSLPGQLVGTIVLDNDEWIAFTTESTFDEIGLCSATGYTRILRTTSVTDRFNFDSNFPIKGKFRVSNRGERVIAWIDDINPPRILNIDTLPFPVNSQKVPTQAGSINTLAIFSAGDPPTISFSLNHTGGFLKSGAYLFSCSYTAQDNTETGYFTVVGPVKVNDETSGSGFAYDGCPANTTTSKSIALFINGVDQRYKYLNIGVVSVIGGETAFKKVGQIEIVEGISSYTFTYVGNETTTDLLLEQLTIQSSGIYQTAKAIAVLNDKLTFGNLSAREPFNFQPYANNISIKWAIQEIYSGSFTNNVNVASLQRGGFRAFEVYAFYIAFRYKDGSYSPAFHIPGRVSIPAELVNSSLGNAQGISAKKYQIEDTCANDGTMSFWENEGETYPSDFPDFAGQKVRHHKFPSLNYIMTNAVALGYSSLSTRMGKDQLPILTFTASNVIIPSELQDQIDGWQIFFARRDVDNQTCVGQSHLNFAHQLDSNASEFSPNTNIFYGPVNARTGCISGTLQFPIQKPCTTKLSLHSPDLLLNKPNVVPSYIRNELTLSAARPSGGANTPIFRYMPTGASNGFIARGFIDYTTLTNTTTAATSSSSLIRSVTPGDALYIAPNTISGRYYNPTSSEYIHLDITNGSTLDIVTAGLTGVIPVSTVSSETAMFERTYLTNICQLLKTVYAPFTTQTLVATTNIIAPSFTTTQLQPRNGDSYTAIYNYVSSIRQDSDGNASTVDFRLPSQPSHGNKYIRNYITECNVNIKMRHEGADVNSKYLGKSTASISTDAQMATAALLENWDVARGFITEFNTDYNIVNTFNPVFPRNTTIDTLTRFPYRFIMSEANANELADSGWRTFLPNNYKDMITTKGEIINLEAYDGVLLIHLENALYRTTGQQTFKTNTEEVTIGTGNILAQEPREILTSELGYLGNQNKFGCGITKLGYVFFDGSQGKLFIVARDVKEISSQGMRNFFRDNFRNFPVGDNPFTTTGVNMAFDEKYNRLILSKKGAGEGFTISYSPDIDGFVSFHDYIPDHMLNTRSKVFSVKENVVYLHNHTNKSIYYDSDVINPTTITVVFNEGSNITKVFSQFNWNNEIVNSSGTSLFNKTFTKATVSNSYQCSGEISLVPNTNVFNAETTWNFNKFYDIVSNRSLPYKDANGLILSNLNTSMAWFKQRKFVDKWTDIKLSYDNIDQNTLFLYDVNASMRKSSR
jgi:hypothetical protein